MNSTDPAINFSPTRCAICETESNATQIYAANFDENTFNTRTFSARRLPDRVRYRMARCNTCHLLRSDPVADSEALHRLYAQSEFNYGDELRGLRKTYARALRRLERFGARHDALLEIGCGNGFFLEEAREQGYKFVAGVEPSAPAKALAKADIEPHIVCDVMREGLFEPNTFDTICFFQVFDHLPAPNETLDQCFEILKPGGLMLFFNHNIEAVSARLLREKSPIIDIEHTYLYSPQTLGALLEKHGFSVCESGGVANYYSLHYLLRLVPLPARLKRIALLCLRNLKLSGLQLPAPLGNQLLIAAKPK